MNNDQEPDHPGSEWVEWTRDDCGGFDLPGMGEPFGVAWGAGFKCQTRAEAVARCRRISRAMLAWEAKKERARRVWDDD